MSIKRNTTQKDIAEACGVSAVCVGYILSGTSKYKFKQETVELVRKTAEKLHYRPNQQAANLRKKENKLIICIVGSCCRYSDTLHIQRLEEEVEKYGYHLLVHFIIGLSDDRKIDFIKKVVNLPAGILIWSLGLQDSKKKNSLLPVLKKAPPSVHMSHAMPGAGVDYVKILWGGKSFPRLIDFFKEKKFKRVGCCLGSDQPRIGESFEELAIQADMLPKCYCTEKLGMNYYEMGRRIARQILTEKKRPEVLYSISDEMTFTIMETLRLNNIRIPENIFIVSGGDSEFLKNLPEPPPYLIHDIPLLVSMAVKDLIARIERGEPVSGTERCIGIIEQNLYFPEPNQL